MEPCGTPLVTALHALLILPNCIPFDGDYTSNQQAAYKNKNLPHTLLILQWAIRGADCQKVFI